MDDRTRRLMTRHKVLHSRDDVDRLHASWKEGGRRFTGIEDSNHSSIERPEDYIDIHKDYLQLLETILTTRKPTERQ